MDSKDQAYTRTGTRHAEIRNHLVARTEISGRYNVIDFSGNVFVLLFFMCFFHCCCFYGFIIMCLESKTINIFISLDRNVHEQTCFRQFVILEVRVRSLIYESWGSDKY